MGKLVFCSFCSFTVALLSLFSTIMMIIIIVVVVVATARICVFVAKATNQPPSIHFHGIPWHSSSIKEFNFSRLICLVVVIVIAGAAVATAIIFLA